MKFLVLEGDGIGPEIARATVTVLAAAALRFGFPLERKESRTADMGGTMGIKGFAGTVAATVRDAKMGEGALAR